MLRSAVVTAKQSVSSLALQPAFIAAIIAALIALNGSMAQEKSPEEIKSEKTRKELQSIREFADAGDHGQAAGALREFVAKYPEWENIADATVLLGRELVLAGDVSSGKQLLQRFIQKHPGADQAATAYFYIAKAQEGLGEFPGAVLSYDVVLQRFDDHKLAPEAALNEARIAGRVLGNERRERRVYEDVALKYPKHSRIAAVRNHLAIMAEKGKGRAGGPTSAFMQSWQIAAPFPNPDGKGFEKVYPPEEGVELDATYIGAAETKVKWQDVPAKSKKANGYVDLQAGIDPNQNVCAYAHRTFKSKETRDGTLYVGSDDGVVIWFNGKKILSRNTSRGAEPDQEQIPVHLKKGENSILLKIIQGTGGWGFYCRLDYEFGWGPTAAVTLYREYAEKHPGDVGDPVLNGDLAGAAAAMWRAAELAHHKLHDRDMAVELYKKYETLPRSKPGEGFYQAARLLWNEEGNANSEMFQSALEEQPDNLSWRYEYARWLTGKKKAKEAYQHLAYVVENTRNEKQLSQALKLMGADKVRTYMDKHPGDYEVFRHYLSWFRAGKKREEGRKVLDRWLKRSNIDWKTAIAQQWFDWTKELKDCRRLVKAAESEGRFRAGARATLQATDKLIHAKMFDEALEQLEQSLAKWSEYADFPRGAFADKIRQVAMAQPLMIPNPEKKNAQKKKEKTDDGEKPDTDKKPKKLPDKVLSKTGKAIRQKATDIIRTFNLDCTADGMNAMARLTRELQPEESIEKTKKAAIALMHDGKIDAAIDHVKSLLENAPHKPETVEVLREAGEKGAKPWGKHWKSAIIPGGKEELAHFEHLKKQTRDTQLAQLKLLRLFDAKKSVAAHDKFLKQYPDSAEADWVARHRYWEIKRAGKDVNKSIIPRIEDVEKNPDVVFTLPLELVPRGPKGREALRKSLR
ncbi:MAG: hypothetical protein KGZ25_13515, partial [Planctomycetes bacterium]|nr:hypothetical protein [Planctomycetota bacterium]